MERKQIGISTPYRQVIDKTAAKRIATVARPWVGLTDEEVEMIVENRRAAHWEFVRQVEAKLKEKNT